MDTKESFDKKLLHFLNEHPKVSINMFQMFSLARLYRNQDILDNLHKLNFVFSVEEEIGLEYKVSNTDTRAIMVGIQDNDFYYIRFYGENPKQYEILHLENESVTFDQIINAFLNIQND